MLSVATADGENSYRGAYVEHTQTHTHEPKMNEKHFSFYFLFQSDIRHAGNLQRILSRSVLYSGTSRYYCLPMAIAIAIVESFAIPTSHLFLSILPCVLVRFGWILFISAFGLHTHNTRAKLYTDTHTSQRFYTLRYNSTIHMKLWIYKFTRWPKMLCLCYVL